MLDSQEVCYFQDWLQLEHYHKTRHRTTRDIYTGRQHHVTRYRTCGHVLYLIVLYLAVWRHWPLHCKPKTRDHLACATFLHKLQKINK